MVTQVTGRPGAATTSDAAVARTLHATPPAKPLTPASTLEIHFDHEPAVPQPRPTPSPRPLIIVGAGPVGLAAAIDARLKGLPVLVFDEDDTVSIGSRAVCYAKRALEVLDRLGVGDPLCDKGVSWNVGRTFFREKEVYRFDLVPEAGHKRPGMINLQQYYLEEMLVARARELGADLRWKYKVISVKPGATPQDAVTLHVETPDGSFDIEADWLVVADGARSPIRRMLGLDIEGKVFQDRFLIADVVMKADFPAERWFWFDPPFHRGQSVLLHKQCDDVWRIDFQLGWDADPEEEKKPAGEPLRNWISLSFIPDLSFVSGEEVCTSKSQHNEHYYCARQDGSHYVGTPTAGNGDNVNGGIALATMLGAATVMAAAFWRRNWLRTK